MIRNLVEPESLWNFLFELEILSILNFNGRPLLRFPAVANIEAVYIFGLLQGSDDSVRKTLQVTGHGIGVG